MHALTGRLRMSYCEAGWTGHATTCSAASHHVTSRCMSFSSSALRIFDISSRHIVDPPPPPSGMFDRERRSWNTAALESASNLHASQLPELADACAAESSLPLLPSCPLYAHLPPHARVLPPISDGAAANLGAGCVDNACACLTVGTSIALRTVVKSSVPPAISSSGGLWCVISSQASFISNRVSHKLAGVTTCTATCG